MPHAPLQATWSGLFRVSRQQEESTTRHSIGAASRGYERQGDRKRPAAETSPADARWFARIGGRHGAPIRRPQQPRTDVDVAAPVGHASCRIVIRPWVEKDVRTLAPASAACSGEHIEMLKSNRCPWAAIRPAQADGPQPMHLRHRRAGCIVDTRAKHLIRRRMWQKCNAVRSDAVPVVIVCRDVSCDVRFSPLPGDVWCPQSNRILLNPVPPACVSHMRVGI
jgi:hypothetical protein